MPQDIQWYPGHMTRTRRQMEASLKLVDAVAEIIDARIPVSSRNPDIDSITAGKPRIILLNKADCADQAATNEWINHFSSLGMKAIACDCRSGKGLGSFVPTVKNILSDKIAAWEKKGMKNRYLKLMVVGIPNVGKSSFINRMSKTSKAKVADRPGVTRGNQWFSVGGNVELLDTPGVLWPKFDDIEVGRRLAFTGAVKDTVLDTEQLACELLKIMSAEYADRLTERYKVIPDEYELPELLLEAIAKKRGMLISGGMPDTERASNILLDEFRAGKLGRITLEHVCSKGTETDEKL
ncbi:MAG: ribosome biogenesis GTPase YlqF [Clostridia bacterium]|nr:ribosome biogenesis GTPase YlqF [Oscillospiraceae bacterium]MBQ6796966.1 ribosome biogenesis GTPase YlqF [Clostridia bacterium]